MLIKKIWKKVSSIGVDENTHKEIRRHVELCNILAFNWLIITCIYFIPFREEVEIIFLLSILVVLHFLALFLNYKKHHTISRIIESYCPILLVTLIGYLTYNGNGAGKINYVVLNLSFAIIPFLLLTLKEKWLIALSLLLSLSTYITFDYFSKFYTLKVFDYLYNSKNFELFNYAVSLCLLSIGFYYLRNVNKKYEDEISDLLNKTELKNIELTEKNIQIENQKNEITASIRYAKRIQEALLPEEEIMYNEIPESLLVFLPKDIISGDFYWIEKVDNKLYFAVVDCTGHGVPGALMSIIGQAILNQILYEFKLRKPSEILDELNKLITEKINKHSTVKSVSDTMNIAICSYDKENNKLEFAGSYHPLYLIKNNKLVVFKPNKIVIGTYNALISEHFNNQEIKLEKDDVIYLFTDGYADQFGGEKNKKFMKKKFLNLLLANNKVKMQQQRDILLNEFIDWKGNYDQTDDVLIIGMKF